MRDMVKLCLAGILFSGGAVLAAEEERPIGDFDKLKASQGISITVACGERPQAVLRGEAKELADIKLYVEDKTLHVERRALIQGNVHEAKLFLTSSRKLTAIATSAGIDLDVPACAVSPEHLDITASTGSDIKLAGKTETLVIDASAGADIKPRKGERIDVGTAKISAKMGAEIQLCRVGKLEGDAGMGANIAAESVDSERVHTYMGADVTTKACQ